MIRDAALAERNAAIFELRRKGHTLRHIAEEFGLRSHEQIRQICLRLELLEKVERARRERIVAANGDPAKLLFRDLMRNPSRPWIYRVSLMLGTDNMTVAEVAARCSEPLLRKYCRIGAKGMRETRELLAQYGLELRRENA